MTILILVGKKTFLNGLEVVGNLDANSINGKNLGANLFSKTTPQVVTSPFLFTDITVSNIHLKTFNKIDMKLIKLAQKKKPIIIHGRFLIQSLSL